MGETSYNLFNNLEDSESPDLDPGSCCSSCTSRASTPEPAHIDLERRHKEIVDLTITRRNNGIELCCQDSKSKDIQVKGVEKDPDVYTQRLPQEGTGSDTETETGGQWEIPYTGLSGERIYKGFPVPGSSEKPTVSYKSAINPTTSSGNESASIEPSNTASSGTRARGKRKGIRQVNSNANSNSTSNSNSNSSSSQPFPLATPKDDFVLYEGVGSTSILRLQKDSQQHPGVGLRAYAFSFFPPIDSDQFNELSFPLLPDFSAAIDTTTKEIERDSWTLSSPRCERKSL